MDGKNIEKSEALEVLSMKILCDVDTFFRALA